MAQRILSMSFKVVEKDGQPSSLWVCLAVLCLACKQGEIRFQRIRVGTVGTFTRSSDDPSYSYFIPEDNPFAHFPRVEDYPDGWCDECGTGAKLLPATIQRCLPTAVDHGREICSRKNLETLPASN